ncbi:hypothetical protein [Nocardia asteroides]|uniref:hypothetical protein n=1 Tax=Nocardia asteroides TaxID=1824 RepID=UPI0034359D08
MTGGAGRWLAYALLTLPSAVSPGRTRLRVPRRLLRESVSAGKVSTPRCLIHSILSVGTGALAWFLTILAGLVLVRGLAYPLVAANAYDNAWGGPTLAGAWAVHAALAVLIAPAFLAVVALLGRFQLRLTRTVLGRTPSWWTIPTALALTAAGTLFFIAWLHQI